MSQITCECGLQSHEDQLKTFPIDILVEAKIPIGTVGYEIPAGTRGVVRSHTDDGRAYVFFDGFTAGHTFHQPELFLEPLESESQKLRRMLATVLDANYGIAFHDIGVGDGIPKEESAEIRLWWEDYLRSKEKKS